MYPKIKKIEILEDYKIKVFFQNEEIKIYDFKPNLENPIFNELKNYSLFKSAVVDAGGYGISWNDDCDLSEYELYSKGINYT